MALNDYLGIKRSNNIKNKDKTDYIIIKDKPLKEKDKKREFELTLNAFKKFIHNGFHKKFFTKRIYDYLHLKCEFIAHFDIDTFYNTYFTTIQGFNIFIDKFEKIPEYRLTNEIKKLVEELNKFTKNK